MSNPYINFALGFQALRRDIERRRCPLQGALGVRAQIYTHQLANVWRILISEEVRHLLADEVGLGKTVQALMVMNALRLQNPKIRILVLVPDRLVPQWRDEILIRGHIAPIEHVEGPDDTHQIRLAWPAQISPTDISAKYYDFLIVDELHQLTTEIQDRVVLESPSFKHILILTATPNFRNATRQVQLFLTLEPARTRIASTLVANSDDGRAVNLGDEPRLSKWPEWALENIVANILTRDKESYENLNENEGDWNYLGGEPPEERREQSVALANCAYRRIIRTRRKNYKGILPHRKHHPIVVEPTHGEVERQQLMWKYLTHLREFSQEFDEVKLAKRVILSPPSLKQRVEFLRRKGFERDNILEKVIPLLSNDEGDSRLDALTDLLGVIWRKNPFEKILVAAQDNLTVDYLFNVIPERLPQIGPRTNRVNLIPARVRQGMMVEAVDDLAGYGNETNENLEEFQRGEAQILFAPEAAQVGLNLQNSRVLVLYSVPWSPEEVEQWIGRLDRIGNTAIQTKDDGVLPVEVYTIALKGLVDEKVVNVLEHFRVFDRNINLDGEHLQEIEDSIKVAALQPEKMKWAALESRADVAAMEDSGQELSSELQSLLPWNAENAIKFRDWIENTPPIHGALRVPHNHTGPRSWDKAIDGWTWLLNKSGEFKFKMHQKDALNPNSRFSSLWYIYGEYLPYREGRQVLSQVRLDKSSGVVNPQIEKHPRNALAFFSRRKDIQQPPRREVRMTIDEKQYPRPLHFLNHGDPLHEDLLAGWLHLFQKAPNGIKIFLPSDHKVIQDEGKGVYITRIAVIDPADYLPSTLDEIIKRIITKVETQLPHEKLRATTSPFLDKLEAHIESDTRWLRSKLPVMLQISSMHFLNGEWKLVNGSFLESMLNPFSSEEYDKPISEEWTPPSKYNNEITQGFDALRKKQSTEAKNAWSSRLPIIDREAKSRIYIISINGQDAVTMRKHVVEKMRNQLEVAKASGVSLSIRRAESAYNTAVVEAEVEEATYNERIMWLHLAIDAIRRPQPETQKEIIIGIQQK